MKTARQATRDARQLWRLCQVNGALDEQRARLVVDGVLASGRSDGRAVLKRFLRLVKLDRAARTARVVSATPLGADVQTEVADGLTRHYGPGITTTFAVDPALIAGVQVQIGSDVYDGSVKARLAALATRF